MNRPQQFWICSVLLVSLALTACTSGSYDSASGRNVDVKLTEHRIDMPSSIPAGTTTFKVANLGQAEHNFELEGQGLEKKLSSSLQPGGTATLTADLKPGTYKAYCPIGNHSGLGMTTQFTVTP